MQPDKELVIGGDFDIEIPQGESRQFPELFREGYFYASGRGALYAIIKHIELMRPDITTVIIPDYICHTVPQTIGRTNLKVEVYHLTEGLEAPESLTSRQDLCNKAVMLVNFFGLMTLEPIVRQIHDLYPDCIVIEDNVQSLYSMLEESSADFRFTSFRKSLPVVDGGWVKTCDKMTEPTEVNKFAQYKIAGGVMKGLRHYQCFDDSLYLRMFELGEEQIDNNLDKGMTQLTRETLSRLDLSRIKESRQRNAAYLVEGLKQVGIEPIVGYDDDKVPLFIPIRLENRDKVRRALFERQIFCPVHWQVVEENAADYSLGRVMSEHELSLIVDQRYGTREMQMILDTIKANI